MNDMKHNSMARNRLYKHLLIVYYKAKFSNSKTGHDMVRLRHKVMCHEACTPHHEYIDRKKEDMIFHTSVKSNLIGTKFATKMPAR